jgi:hypothetical protein
MGGQGTAGEAGAYLFPGAVQLCPRACVSIRRGGRCVKLTLPEEIL